MPLLPSVFVASGQPLYLPLGVAAAILYRAFLQPGEKPAQSEAELEARIDEAARAVSLALRVYRIDGAQPAEIAAETLAAGAFAGGGARLVFTDGRAPLESLAVNRIDFDHALTRRADLILESRPEVIVPSKFGRPKLPKP